MESAVAVERRNALVGPAPFLEQRIRRLDRRRDHVPSVPASSSLGCVLHIMRRGVLGRGRGIDPLERDGQGAIEVGRAQVRQHVVVVDRLALLVRQERRLEPRAGIQLDLTVLEVRLEVEEFLRGSFLDPAKSPIVAVSSLSGAGFDVDYVSIRGALTLDAPAATDPELVVLAAARIGRTRLIDNLRVRL